MTEVTRRSQATEDTLELHQLAHLPVRRLPHWGRWLSGAFLLLLLGALLRAFAVSQINWSVVRSFFTASTVIHGFLITLVLTAISMILGLVLGTVFAVGRLSANPVTSSVSWLYVWFFRGTPVLLQILLWFNLAIVFPTITIPGVYSGRTIDIITPFLAGILALGINEGAYLTEIIRAGILSVDEGQEEAATAMGLSRFQTLRYVVLPQALRVIVPPVGNETIGMLKTSSLVAVISVGELLGTVQEIYFVNGQVIELLIVAGIWYLIATSFLSVGQYYIERRLGRGLSRGRRVTLIERLARRTFAAIRPAATRRGA